jgi:hypothetical protein
MKVLTYVKLCLAERSLVRLTDEIAAAWAYERDLERGCMDEGWCLEALAREMREVEAKITALEEERDSVIRRIARLKYEG